MGSTSIIIQIILLVNQTSYFDIKWLLRHNTVQSFYAILSVYAIVNNDSNTSEQFTSSLISWTDSLSQTSIYKNVKSSLHPLHIETTHFNHSHYYYLNMCITNTTWTFQHYQLYSLDSFNSITQNLACIISRRAHSDLNIQPNSIASDCIFLTTLHFHSKQTTGMWVRCLSDQWSCNENERQNLLIFGL